MTDQAHPKPRPPTPSQAPSALAQKQLDAFNEIALDAGESMGTRALFATVLIRTIQSDSIAATMLMEAIKQLVDQKMLPLSAPETLRRLYGSPTTPAPPLGKTAAEVFEGAGMTFGVNAQPDRPLCPSCGITERVVIIAKSNGRGHHCLCRGCHKRWMTK